VSTQIAILKVLASHGSGRASIASLNRDIAVLSASGVEWSARLRRLASRVRAIDIFGAGYVVRDDEGWEITAAGRGFLHMLEAVTQDNLPASPAQPVSIDGRQPPRGELIVVGHRFKSRIRGKPALRPAASGPGNAAGAPRGRNM
jgi:hypothetical protein